MSDLFIVSMAGCEPEGSGTVASAGRGPCGRPPLQGNQFPIRGADGHKGRALQMAEMTHERPKGTLPRHFFVETKNFP